MYLTNRQQLVIYLPFSTSIRDRDTFARRVLRISDNFLVDEICCLAGDRLLGDLLLGEYLIGLFLAILLLVLVGVLPLLSDLKERNNIIQYIHIYVYLSQ